MLKIKNRNLIIIIFSLFVLVFSIQYFLIISYINEMFQYVAVEVKNEVAKSEMKLFKSYLFKNFIFTFLQSIGMFLCLNIGFLYFKIKTNFRNLFSLIVLSALSTLVCQLLIIVIIKLNNWTFTMGSINETTEKLNLGNYINVEKTAPWIKLSLVSINLEQLLIVLFLGVGVHEILKIKYNRSFSIIIKTYGLGILLWFVFAMVMEMNFS